MSYISANTPWFFNGVRVQAFPNDKLKIEYWLINGWQSYGMFDEMPGIGWQILWRPSGNFSFVTNEYFGKDTLENPGRLRMHSDTSVQLKYYDHPERTITKMAFSVAGDIGCEDGGGVGCFNNSASTPAQYFIGGMAYDRIWFDHDHFGLTIGGGAITNPGRYLVLIPPINGETASTAVSGSPYFDVNAGSQFHAWDSSITLQYMPDDHITFDLEFIHRNSSVPYFAGGGGMTPPGGNNGNPTQTVSGWTPDLSTIENRINLAMLVRL